MAFDCIVMGAAGRDFHDFKTFFGAHPEMRVRCFTATQIPFIDQRIYPKELAPAGYDDVPIYPEERLVELIARWDVDFVFLAYTDLAYEDVMHKASIVQAAGASFAMLGPKHTELVPKKPLIAVTAVRTGAGKSPLSQALAAHLVNKGLGAGVIRHPMPYGDLARQAVQRFSTPEDLDRHECTVEEREEYEPYVERGLTIFAGVDYTRILAAAEAESDVILWDGGNNDYPFYRAGLQIVVADALRAGHESRYYPGETNARRADVWVINKVNEARPEDVAALHAAAARLCPEATVIESDLEVSTDDPDALSGKRVLVIEDGPTLTHGGMSFGAGTLAARRAGAELIDPRPFAVGTVAAAYKKYPHVGPVLPALGYSEEQRAELAATIRAAKPDVVLDASPASLKTLLQLDLPVQRVRYEFVQRTGPDVFGLVDAFLEG
ncbi:MAG: GTPase [Deltaproteobacteria bacterium]|nr:GTPase [Deltaproteobacteria bacterium]